MHQEYPSGPVLRLVVRRQDAWWLFALSGAVPASDPGAVAQEHPFPGREIVGICISQTRLCKDRQLGFEGVLARIVACVSIRRYAPVAIEPTRSGPSSMSRDCSALRPRVLVHLFPTPGRLAAVHHAQYPADDRVHATISRGSPSSFRDASRMQGNDRVPGHPDDPPRFVRLGEECQDLIFTDLLHGGAPWRCRAPCREHGRVVVHRVDPNHGLRHRRRGLRGWPRPQPDQ